MTGDTTKSGAAGVDEAALLGPFLSLASFRVPHRLVMSAWLEHAPFANWLIDVQRPDSLVELGTHNGYSYLAFCEAVQAAGLATRCAAVDTWLGDEHSGFYGEEVFIRLKTYHDGRYADFSRLIRSTFLDALDQFPDGSVDLLHIDGRHGYDDVKEDFTNWQPKLTDRAVVLFHDVEVRERDFGVHRLWDELCAQYPHFTFKHCNGLGVLGVGPNQPPRLAALFGIGDDKARARVVRAAYVRLGGAVTESWEKAVARHEANGAERARADVKRLKGELDNLRKTLASVMTGAPGAR